MAAWSFAVVELGLSDEQFGWLTQRMFHALLERYQERKEHQELLSGIVAANIANQYSKTPMKADQFMPSRIWREQVRRKPQQELTPEELKAKLDRIFGT